MTNEFQENVMKSQNPYGDGNTSEKIVQIITEQLLGDNINLQKKFYNVDFEI